MTNTRLKVIVFDFDGVIVDSNHIKEGAYYKVFSSFKNSKELIRNVLEKAEPSTRQFIICKIINKLAQQGLMENKDVLKYKKSFIKDYSKIVEKGVLECNEINGALNSLKILSTKYNLYINSLTPLTSLKKIMRKRGFYKYFIKIFGGSSSKEDNIKSIIQIENITPSQLVFIGDSINDLEVTRKAHANFIGIDSGNEDIRSKKIKYLLQDCSQLCENIKILEQEVK